MPLSRIGTNSITDYAIGATDLANNSIETYTSNAGRPLTNRNLIINGAMQVAQRNTSVTGITTTGHRTADRWLININSAGTWTMNVESSAPTGTEFRKSSNVICTTADSSLSAGDYFIIQQRIEGQNVQGLKKGTANAESLTVSFYVKSSNTGTYICEFEDVDNTRSISKSYTINAANTWEKKTITIPPDTTGQFDNDNGTSLSLNFWIAAGTDFSSGTLNSSAWASIVSANRAAGQLNLANLSGNYFAFTGIQLETGTVATPYEWMDFGTELRRCQRYYERSYDYGTYTFSGEIMKGIAAFGSPFHSTGASTNVMNTWLKLWLVTKRTQPTVTGFSLTDGVQGKWRRYYTGVSPADDQNVTFGQISETGSEVSVAAGGNCNQVLGHWVADAEL